MKCIDLDDLDPNWQTSLTLGNNKSHTELTIPALVGKIFMSVYNLGNGISLCSCKSLFNEDVRCISKSVESRYFATFNHGEAFHSFSMLNSHEDSRVNLAENSLTIGSFGSHFSFSHLFAKGRLYLTTHLMFDEPTYDALLPHQNTSRNKIVTIEHKRGISAKERALLAEIERTKLFEGRLQEIYIESRILELSYEAFRLKPQESTLNESELKCIQKAREILLSDLRNPPTIRELARKSAINECTLKQGFKQLYGETIHGALHEARMQESKQLLLRGEISVKEAANLVGYRSLGYFSKIFKERFNILPVKIR